MAYYALEPFGDHIADLRHGTACALLANVNRSPDNKPEPYRPDDFIYWTKKQNDAESEKPIDLVDPIAQSKLIKAAIFGIAPKP